MLHSKSVFTYCCTCSHKSGKKAKKPASNSLSSSTTHIVPESVSNLKKGFPTINFIIVITTKHYESDKRGNQVRNNKKSVTEHSHQSYSTDQ